MIITFEGRDWEFDREKITVDEWRDLKRKYKMSPKGFEEGSAEADPDAMTFLYWTMLRQSGDQRAVLGDQLKPDIIALHRAMGAAIEAELKAGEPEPEPEPDPTPPSASPPGSPPAPETQDPAPGRPEKGAGAAATA